MSRKNKLYTYVVRRTARDERGAFTADKAAETFARSPRKFVEARARHLSATWPAQLVTMLRGPEVLVMLLNGVPITAAELVADIAARGGTAYVADVDTCDCMDCSIAGEPTH